MAASDYDISPWRFPVFSYGLEMACLDGQPATLMHHRLTFDWLPAGAVTTVANIVPMPSITVDGVFCELPEHEFRCFDAEQRRPRRLVRILCNGEPEVGWAYYAPAVTRYRAPSPSYVTALLAAASLVNVSDAHIMEVTAAAHQLWLGRRQHTQLQMIQLAGQPGMN